MVLLSISFENMHQILRNLYDTMTKLCHPMMDMAMALAALGALFYIAYRVWQSLSRAEPIDVFSMLRPFVLSCFLDDKGSRSVLVPHDDLPDKNAGHNQEAQNSHYYGFLYAWLFHLDIPYEQKGTRNIMIVYIRFMLGI